MEKIIGLNDLFMPDINDYLFGHFYPKLRQYTTQALSWAAVDVSDNKESQPSAH